MTTPTQRIVATNKAPPIDDPNKRALFLERAPLVGGDSTSSSRVGASVRSSSSSALGASFPGCFGDGASVGTSVSVVGSGVSGERLVGTFVVGGLLESSPLSGDRLVPVPFPGVVEFGVVPVLAVVGVRVGVRVVLVLVLSPLGASAGALEASPPSLLGGAVGVPVAVGFSGLVGRSLGMLIPIPLQKASASASVSDFSAD